MLRGEALECKNVSSVAYFIRFHPDVNASVAVRLTGDGRGPDKQPSEEKDVEALPAIICPTKRVGLRPTVNCSPHRGLNGPS